MAQQDTYAFTLSQVAHIEQQVYKVKYPRIQYPRTVDIDMSAWEWADTIVHFSQDMQGRPSWMNPDANDMPVVNLTRDKHTVRSEQAWLGYTINEKEIQQAMRLPGGRLRADKAMAVREGYERFVEDYFINGSTEFGWDGFINASGVDRVTATDGAGGSALWDDKTDEEILRDIDNALTGVYANTLEVEMADCLALPVEARSILINRVIDGTSRTLYQHVMENNVYTAETEQPLKIKTIRELRDAGASDTGRIIAYRKAPDVVKLHIPQPIKFWPMWQLGPLVFNIPATFNLGGLEIRRKKAFRYVDGIIDL